MAKIGTTLFTAKDAIGMSEFVTLPGAQAVHRQDIAPRWSIGWRTPSASCTGTSTRRTTTRRRRSPARLVKAPPERFGWVFTKTDQYRDPDMLPNLAALQRNVDMTKELGYASASFDVKAYSDLSMVEEAASA